VHCLVMPNALLGPRKKKKRKSQKKKGRYPMMDLPNHTLCLALQTRKGDRRDAGKWGKNNGGSTNGPEGKES